MNPDPLITFVLLSSNVNTSPTTYPTALPRARFEIPFAATIPPLSLTEQVNPVPSPVNDFNGIKLPLFPNEYPDPRETISNDVALLGLAPLASTIPVIEVSSVEVAAFVPLSVLTFLPTANSVAVLVLLPANLTLSFLGKVLTGLSDNT